MLDVLILFVLICLLRAYDIYFLNVYKIKKSQKGKVFLITGANSGIGKECARQLVEKDATVILACRNKEAAELAIADIRTLTSSGELIFHHVDMAELASVRQFAEEILKKYPKIDVLINNAGVSVPTVENAKTADGFEIHFGVNYLSHFLLTQLLLPKLVESAPSRIVVVSSMLYTFGRIRFDDFNLDRLRASGRKDWLNAGYGNSKLAMYYHGRELAERLKGKNVDVRIVCPGVIRTGIHRQYKTLKHVWLYLLAMPVFAIYSEPTWKGAHKVLQLAVEDEDDLEGKSGDFYMFFKRTEPIRVKMDPQVQNKLWEVSEKLVQL